MVDLEKLTLKYPLEAKEDLKVWTALTNYSWPHFEDLSLEALKTITLNTELFLVPFCLHNRIIEANLASEYCLPLQCQPQRLEDGSLKVDDLLSGCIELDRFGVTDIDKMARGFLSWPYPSSKLSKRNRNKELSFCNLVDTCKAVAATKHLRDYFDFNRCLSGHPMNNHDWEKYEDSTSKIALKAPLVKNYEIDEEVKHHGAAAVQQIYESSYLIIPESDAWISIDEVLKPRGLNGSNILKF
ncbi:MAG: hypothetical protein PHQ59_05135 [Candidatus Daviesbacteria bacterium]|nr:hypothetical protein [Candidatus Daviesbacteria bacterium]